MNYSNEEDSTLYIAKKILVEDWRDDSGYPICELDYKKMDVTDLFQLIWHLFIYDGFYFGANTLPENLVIDASPDFWSDICINWKLIDELKSNNKIDEISIEFDTNEFDGLEKYIKEQIVMFVSNKPSKKETSLLKKMGMSDIEFYKMPTFRRGNYNNYYTYQKQRDLIIKHIKNLFELYNNKYITIDFKSINDNGIDILRTLISLEYEGILKIIELSNKKQKWIDENDVFAKIKILKLSDLGFSENLIKIPKKLPSDCFWKNTEFICGNKTINFYDTKTYKYFVLLTNNLGVPVINEECYKNYDYDKPKQVALGVKKDLTRKLNKVGLLKNEENTQGRVSITPISKMKKINIKKAGYVCEIS